jgi:hypothetical protein
MSKSIAELPASDAALLELGLALEKQRGSGSDSTQADHATLH